MTEDAEAARLHRELLLLAGRVPDDVLARARLTLAEGDLRTVGAVVTELSAGRDRSPYAFVAELPAPGRHPALVLDLTTGPDVRDPADRAAARALVRVPEAVALWRAWRVLPGLDPDVVPPTRVYVLEASTIASLPAVTAVVMRALLRAGVPDPQVEAYPSGIEPPGYQRDARAASALLWTAGEARPVRIAEALTRDPIAEDERDKVAAYLENGTIVLTTTRRGIDLVEPGRGAVVPLGHRTDGRWVWTEATAYYLRVHGFAPDAGLLAGIRSAGYAPAPAGPVGTHRALAALLGQGE
ncbi:hypothetical protein ACPCHT_13235 [Nucisporomicrobium flavum]|uniref:hypothetical protein n=1 Tax=Nucisporomicrobium flavum TaxID=2785915 RepID=UPI003C2DE8B1